METPAIDHIRRQVGRYLEIHGGTPAAIYLDDARIRALYEEGRVCGDVDIGGLAGPTVLGLRIRPERESPEYRHRLKTEWRKADSGTRNHMEALHGEWIRETETAPT